MPRAPRFKTSSIGELYRQLRYAPAETRERLMASAEALVDEVDADRVYPGDFITYRITGYRPESTDESLMLVGGAVLSDLATLVQKLSSTLILPASCPQRGEATPIDALAARLDITDRTLRRYHHRGLLFHYVSSENGPRLACYDGAFKRFQSVNPTLVNRAVEFSRLDDALERQIIEEAVEQRLKSGASRQQLSRLLAGRHGRSVETMRSLLARHEAQQGHVVFGGHRKTADRERRIIWRAWRRGLGYRHLAEHLGCSVSTVRRVVGRARAARLRAIELKWVEFPTFQLDDAEAVILSPESVKSGLGPIPGSVDGLALISSKAPLEDDVEADRMSQQLAAFNLLKRRAVMTIGDLPVSGVEETLDSIDRDLRWVALLKRTLVREAIPFLVLRLEHNLHRPLVQHARGLLVDLLAKGISELGDVMDVVDPSQGQSVQRMAGLVIDRRLARMDLGGLTTRAGARHTPGSIDLGDSFARLSVWEPQVDLPARFVARLDGLDSDGRKVVDDVYGREGNAPLTIPEIAVNRGCSVRSVRTEFGRAMRTLIRPDSTD